MDSLTQAVLGATVYGVGMGRYQKKKALVYGAILGTLPDLDVLIRYSDPISAMTYHRGASHSLWVLTLLALLLTYLARSPKRDYSLWRLFFSIEFALITHPLLDACTVYGTQLFWPFTWTPAQWSGVFIIDPLYTLPMLLAGIYAWRQQLSDVARGLLLGAFLWGCIYLAWGIWGQYHHQQRVQDYLTQQGYRIVKIMATPTPFNTMLFRVVAKTADGQYIEALSGWLDHVDPEYVVLPQGDDYEDFLQQHGLYQRLKWFSDGWLRIEQQQDALVVTDMRMGLYPDYYFRFKVAHKQHGQWQQCTPTRLDEPISRSLTLKNSQALWRRIKGGTKRLPAW